MNKATVYRENDRGARFYGRTCKASVLVERLNEMIAEYGDLPIWLNDPDTNWRLQIGVVACAEPQTEPARFEITADYYSDPEGKLPLKRRRAACSK